MLASFLLNWVKDNMKREEGQAMAEYGIILALIAAVCITLLLTLGGDIQTALQKLVDGLKSATGA
jgi:pilus assembly protein Flp/PilA